MSKDRDAASTGRRKAASLAAADEGAATSAEALTAGRPVWLLRRVFDDQSTEELYQRYCQHHKELDADCFFVAAFLVAAHSAAGVCFSDAGSAPPWANVALSLAATVVAVAQVGLGLCVRHWRLRRTKTATQVVVTATYSAWLLVNVLVLCLLATPSAVSHLALTWLVLINFLTCVTLPFRLLTCLVFTSTTGLLLVTLSAWKNSSFVGAHHHPIASIGRQVRAFAFSKL